MSNERREAHFLLCQCPPCVDHSAPSTQVAPSGVQMAVKHAARPIPLKLRQQILTRDDHTCTRCDQPIRDSDYSLHHRLPRGRGGQHTPENLVTVCGSATTGCHQVIESYRARATVDGWLVPSGINPAAWPVHRVGQWLQPTATGWEPSEPHPTLQADQRVTR